jgi:hypothetical protein
MHLTHMAAFPRMLRVRRLNPPSLPLDVDTSVRDAFSRSGVLTALSVGARVAVAVGSRGIAGHAALVQATVNTLRESGCQPFLLPAMGSHGGATPAGQLQILADQGIVGEDLGVPVEASMDAPVVGHTDDGIPVHCAAAARGVDAIVLLNRVKPHTDFGGALGSGLLKMAVVGLGKHSGALAFHRAANRLGYEHALRSMARVVLSQTPVLCGLAVIESANHQVAAVEVVRASRLEAEETRLAAHAARLMPRLPLEEIDVLIVDRIGKNLSGTGMDPNVIGRPIHGYSLVESEMPRHPRIRRIVVLDLTPESHGNATGIGLADFTTDRLVRAMDAQATYTNALTALSLQGSKIPIHFETDREVIGAALASLGLEDPRQARVLRIHDTLSLETLEASEACLHHLRTEPGLDISTPACEMQFDAEDRLTPWPAGKTGANATE